ncbi:unnamed protein product [Clonostachys byssicola]|uniref:HNH nuclease domain-containing protein n=1 Tax=Clonostachys byssicola TaxID=160290 RepID=A0A9N9Y400_9HYPO|nr:unnamed protein product [Clonostachys byssicola]
MYFFNVNNPKKGPIRPATIRKSTQDYDKDRCVVTGLANPQDCHIIPFTWNSTEEQLQIPELLQS